MDDKLLFPYMSDQPLIMEQRKSLCHHLSSGPFHEDRYH
jgi:hypothetical protein